jgi:hypothetical protein
LRKLYIVARDTEVTPEVAAAAADAGATEIVRGIPLVLKQLEGTPYPFVYDEP